MMPQLVTVGYRRTRVWIPVLPVVLVLSPLLLFAVIGGLVACRVAGISPLGTLRGVGRFLCALPGTRIEIADGEHALLLSVR
ncbi:hypothetical protein Afil01_14230 [Actinorhabdospora filicis]|uniref:Uncharacterized protein n=1 Tax=Actinorhabdospora filicis TaxID=1785913 RepID=A0A9W6SL57_9ACTN|nr:hypothetical protein [Actinorhabdospora filicis]GLZ76616.1 hypothetical protein Afil01_14230 [Actinorhabdospora filicis]